MGVLKPIRLSGWIRAMKEDVELTYKLVPEIEYLALSTSTSTQMINGKYLGKKTPKDVTKDDDPMRWMQRYPTAQKRLALMLRMLPAPTSII